MRHRRRGMLVGLLGTVVGATVMFVGATLATSPVDVSFEVLGQATLDAFRHRQHKFQVISREEGDVVIAKVTIDVGGDTGWHTHPGPAFATIVQGVVEHTIVNEDGSCRKEVHGPGEGITRSGGIVHIARNVGDSPLVAYTTFLAVPPGSGGGGTTDFSPLAPTGRGC
jgi:quercetin dioxygenase-like cupin family protein